MRIILSSVLDYCGGVKRALALAENVLKENHGQKVYSLGQLIHNRIVTDKLERDGLIPIDNPEEGEGGILVVRAHGMSASERKSFLSGGYTLVDATCPVVSHNLALIATYALDHQILVIGEEGHEEVNAMMGVEHVHPILVSCPDDAHLLEKDASYAAFVQTTFSENAWKEIRDALSSYHVEFVNKICPASTARRKAVVELARQCDALVIVGGRNSANTQALASLARQVNPSLAVFPIEHEDQVTDAMRCYPRVGLATGASTAHETLRRVEKSLLGG